MAISDLSGPQEQTSNIEIGLSGLAAGPFPKAEEIGSLLSQWLLLPRAEKLGLSQDELAGAVGDCCGLVTGRLDDWAEEVRRVLIPHFNESITKLAEKVPKTYTVLQAGRDGPITREKTEEERAAEVLALFSALYAYISCAERHGVDRANAYSFLIYETLSRESPGYALKIPELLCLLQQINPGQFIKGLSEYPDNALVILPMSTHLGIAGYRRMREEYSRNPSMPSPKPDSYVIAGSMRKAGEASNPNLHDAGYYLESLAVSLLLGRPDFIPKGVNLSIAQQEGLATMDGHYAELGGEQGIAESFAQDYLDQKSGMVITAGLPNGEALRRVEETLGELQPLMTSFKELSTRELEDAERLRKMAQPVSLEADVELEDGETATLADMIPAPAGLEEAILQLRHIIQQLEPEDAELLTERFIDGKSISEIAIEKGWEYSRAQKRIYRLVDEIRQKMT